MWSIGQMETQTNFSWCDLICKETGEHNIILGPFRLLSPQAGLTPEESVFFLSGNRNESGEARTLTQALTRTSPTPNPPASRGVVGYMYWPE